MLSLTWICCQWLKVPLKPLFSFDILAFIHVRFLVQSLFEKEQILLKSTSKRGQRNKHSIDGMY